MREQRKCKECGSTLDSGLSCHIRMCSQACRDKGRARAKAKSIKKAQKKVVEQRAKKPIYCLYCDAQINPGAGHNIRYCNDLCRKSESNKRSRARGKINNIADRRRRVNKASYRKHRIRYAAARGTPEYREKMRILAQTRTYAQRVAERKKHAEKKGREFIPRGPLKVGVSERKALADFQYWLKNIASDVCLDYFYAGHEFDDHRLHSAINDLKIESIRLLKLEEQPIEHIRLWKKHAVKFCRYCDTQIINAATGRNRFKLCSDECKRAENLYNLKRNYGSKQT